MMDSFVARRYLLLAFLLGLALVFQGSRGLYDRDETRYAEVAREMLVSGEYLIPQRDFRPHLTKPPLTYWALAASMKILGQNEWAVRLPNALAFALTAFVVGLIGEALWGRRGLWAGVIYATSLFPFAAANIVTTDTLLVLWETAAAWAFVKGYLSQRAERARVWFNLMWFFWGLGFLTKGPAIFPMAAGLVVFWLLKRREYPRHPWPLEGVAIFLLVSLSWYIFVAGRISGSLSLILNEQIIGRLFSSVYHRNCVWYAPFYLYLPIILLGPFPWAFMWPQALREMATGLRSKSLPGLLLGLWFLVPLVVFSLAKSRLPLYVLPLFAPISLMFYFVISREAKKGLSLARSLFSLKVLAVWVLILWGLKFGAVLVKAPQDARAYAQAFAPYLDSSPCLLGLGDSYFDGLSFYTGLDFEYLPQPGDEGKAYVEDSWPEEVAEIRSRWRRCLLVAKGGDFYPLIPLLQKEGLKVRELSSYGKLRLYEIGLAGDSGARHR